MIFAYQQYRFHVKLFTACQTEQFDFFSVLNGETSWEEDIEDKL